MMRYEIFESLQTAHHGKWNGYDDRCLHPTQGNPLFTWWMQWWSILEKEFPDYIKDGQLTSQYHTDQRYYREGRIKGYHISTPRNT